MIPQRDRPNVAAGVVVEPSKDLVQVRVVAEHPRVVGVAHLAHGLFDQLQVFTTRWIDPPARLFAQSGTDIGNAGYDAASAAISAARQLKALKGVGQAMAT